MDSFEKKNYKYINGNGTESLSIFCSSKKNGLKFTVGDKVILINDKDELLRMAEYIKYHAANDCNGIESSYASTGFGISIISVKNGSVASREIQDNIELPASDENIYQTLSERFNANGEIIAVYPLYEGIINRSNIVKSIVTCIELQKAFVLSGEPSDCHPMTLNDVKDKTGLDITTISRCTRNVSIYTIKRTFTLDARGGDFKTPSLFDEGISMKDFGSDMCEPNLFDNYMTCNDQKVARIEVLATINDMIAAENRSKPLTDDEISDELQKKGYAISRRTVAKYRESFLGYKNSNARKKYS